MLFCLGHRQMNESKLSLIAVTLCFTVGIAIIEIVASQFGGGGLSVNLMFKSMAIAALCGLIVDLLRFASGRISLKPHPSLKCRRPGKDISQLLERSLGPAPTA